MTTSRHPFVRTTARVLAVALAAGIVGWLVMRAQRGAHAIDLPVTTEPAGDFLTLDLPVTTEPVGQILTMPAGLSSSKSLVIESEPAEPPLTAPRRTRKTVISPLQDSKAGLVAPAADEPADQTLLFGSKSGPVPAAPPAPAPAPGAPLFDDKSLLFSSKSGPVPKVEPSPGSKQQKQ